MHTPLHAVTREPHLHCSGLEQDQPLHLPDPLTAPAGRAEGTAHPTRPHMEGASGMALLWARCWKHRHVYMCRTLTHTEQRTPAITQTDVLSYTHSSYRDDGKGTLNPLTTHWEDHKCKSEFYKV